MMKTEIWKMRARTVLRNEIQMHTRVQNAGATNRKCDRTVKRRKEEKRVIGLSPKQCLGGVRSRGDDARRQSRAPRDIWAILGVISAIPKFGKMVVCCSNHTSNVELLKCETSDEERFFGIGNS